MGPRVMVFRVRYRIRGTHVHCRVFTATAPSMTLEKSGDLVFRVAEWAAVRDTLQPVIEFIDDDEAGAHDA